MFNIKKTCPSNKTPRDQNRRPHGEWIGYHGNKNLWCKWNYVHGIKQGLQQAYHEDGLLWYKGHMNKNQRFGYWYYNNQPIKYYLCLV